MKKRVYRERYYGTPSVEEETVETVEQKPAKKKRTRLVDKIRKTKKKSDK